MLCMQFVFLAVMLVHEQLLMNKDYYALSITSVAIILSTILLQIPLMYSILIWGTGYLLNATLQFIILISVISTGWVSPVELQNSPLIQSKIMGIMVIVIGSLIYYMHKKRIGFMFIANRFRLSKSSIRLKDILVAAIFICTVSLVQVSIMYFLSNKGSLYLLITLAAMIVVMLLGLFIIYKLNMQEIEERFNSFRRKKP